jgi:hypothetical protein
MSRCTPHLPQVACRWISHKYTIISKNCVQSLADRVEKGGPESYCRFVVHTNAPLARARKREQAQCIDARITIPGSNMPMRAAVRPFSEKPKRHILGSPPHWMPVDNLKTPQNPSGPSAIYANDRPRGKTRRIAGEVKHGA